MAEDALGQNSHFGFKTEAAFGTLLASEKFLDIISESMQETDEREYAHSLADISTNSDDVIIKKKKNIGSVTFFQHWEGAEILLLHAFGGVTTTTPDATNAPTARQHVFAIGETLPESLSAEIRRDIASMFVAGCRVKQIKFTLPLGGYLTTEITLVGSITTYDTAGTKTVTTTKRIKSTDVVSGFISYDSGQVKIRAFDITLTNDLDEDDTDYTSQNIGQMVRKGFLNVEGNFECKWDDETARRADFAAATSRVLQAKFEGATIGGAIKQTFQLDLPAIQLDKFDNSVSAMGRIWEKIKFKGMKSGANREVKLTLINAVASVS